MLTVMPVRAGDAPTVADLFPVVDHGVVEISTVQQTVADQGPARRVSSGELGSGFLISSGSSWVMFSKGIHSSLK